MDAFLIRGGVPLSGTVAASGAKNAALPILAASILASQPVRLAGIPNLADVDTLALVLGYLGVEVRVLAGGRLEVETVDPRPIRADYHLVRRMRASFCVLGPLLARRGRAVVSLPGGCRIGERPVDLHLRGLAALGADLRIAAGYVTARCRRLRGATIELTGPRGPTVTGTANVMSAAVLARGRTVLVGAAREPEIVDLGNFLAALGAKISGLRTGVIEIEGVEGLGGASYTIIPDRIETATLLMAAAITGGSATVVGARPDHLSAVLEALAEVGCAVEARGSSIALSGPGRLKPRDVTAVPYPGIPTDLQSQFMALACVAAGRSRVADRVFPERFLHVDELRRLGARIERDGAGAVVRGVARLQGAEVRASDLRASAALVLAGLAARGETRIEAIQNLDRGYERLEEKLARLGARIERVGKVQNAKCKVQNAEQ